MMKKARNSAKLKKNGTIKCVESLSLDQVIDDARRK